MSCERRTFILLATVAVALAAANSISIRIPFVGEQEADGYMLKTGWPCSFREETRRRLYWEWNDALIDGVVAAAILAAVAWSSHRSIRRSRQTAGASYTRFVAFVVMAACVIGVNLHEHTTAAATTRGWPLPALINGPFGIHHNRIDAAGAALDAAAAGAIIVAGLWALRWTGIEARLRRWIG